MKTTIPVIRLLVGTLFVIINLISSALAQEVIIPDPGLNAAIRAAILKPAGPLDERDLLSLTVLDAGRRNVRSLEGLEAARNLVALDLQINQLTSFAFPNGLTNLGFLNLSSNPLTNCFLPNGLANLAKLVIDGTLLTNFALPTGLTGLSTLVLANNPFATFNLPSNLPSLNVLDLGFNSLTHFSLPSALTNLTKFTIAGNLLTNFTVPAQLTGLNELNLSQNQLTTFSLPAGMSNLFELNLFFNQLTNVTLPGDLKSLTELNLDFNRFTKLQLPSNLSRLSFLRLRANLFTSVNLPEGMTDLTFLDIGENKLTNLTLPADLSNLAVLRLPENKLTSLTLPPGLTNLMGVNLRFNELTNLVLPPDLNHLVTLDLLGNQLASINLPAGLANLANLFLGGNELTTLTLPPDMTQLSWLVLEGNPLATLVLSEPLSAGNLAELVASLRNSGVSVFTYPLTIRLFRLRLPVGAFQFAITGPPGIYTILGSTNLTVWDEVGAASNGLGTVVFTDVTAHFSSNKFYRALLQTPPANMVFIPPSTFTMGSPVNELHRDANEGPQTTVTLSRGFWIGKYEVTQAEYLSVMNTNPSAFPGDLGRPVSSVSWPDATNFCARLTERELEAGRIPFGSHYRLPTEAEWECAARAGTTTRFSYGDDPSYASLTNHAWYFLNSALTVHPVGQKLPNPWGLYDMEGNVWEWCQDWLGPLPGGTVNDPQGPPSNPIGVKVIRGGAYDFGETDCRSARRFFFGVHPALTDTDLGFRVVLATDLQ